ncbi:MAG TPA: methyltransferase domain-containing protein, partial [Rhodanobacteraceae bacterium]|nr:methyltransferase domain-containing protein [Rhodanobacteraceae bacterium]
MNRADFYDAELRRHNRHFRAAFGIGPSDRVLDIGCGAGQSTRQAAAAAVRGSVLGVDVSEELLRVARQRSAEVGLSNVAFELGDAQVHPFPASHFDVCISRFGVMFFADPVVAFTHIGRAMCPGARLVLMVWQNHHRNEWAVAVRDALAPLPGPGPDAAMFSLGDPAVATGVLTAAGFSSVGFGEVHEPVFYGANIDVAYETLVDLFVESDTGGSAANDEVS